MKWVFLSGGGLVVLAAILAVIGDMLARELRAAAGVVPAETGSHLHRSGRLGGSVQRRHNLRQPARPRRPRSALAPRHPQSDKNLPFGGTWNIEISPASEGNVVRITEDGEIRNAIFRFLARFSFGSTATIEGHLRDLGRHFDEVTAMEPQKWARQWLAVRLYSPAISKVFCSTRADRKNRA